MISVNFVGTAGSAGTLQTSDQAGDAGQSAFVSNWNNAANATGSLPSLLDDAGQTTSVGVTWNAPGTFQLSNTSGGTNVAGGANPAMMKGYLDFTGNGSTQQTTVTMTGLVPTAASYSVIVYFDGANGTAWRVANFAIGSDIKSGEDSESVDFNSGTGNNADGRFQIPVAGTGGNQNWPSSPNNSEGNMVVFTGLTSPNFTLVATGGANQGSSTFRAPVNGIQVVGIPEPASLAMVGIGAIGLLMRRRHRKI